MKCTMYSPWKLINLSGNCLQRLRELAKHELILVGHCLMDVQLLLAALIYTTVKALVIDTLDKTLYEISVQKNLCIPAAKSSLLYGHFFCFMMFLYRVFNCNVVVFHYFRIFAIIFCILVFLSL